ncbi:uncharacterized protein LOC8083224 [Sorghum bicolor]|uniref:Uncharacterized protein n=1 Tax=Sorghum bicolor TaxID=4558 RepID=C5X2C3_SORBI|nr:uncharacterized protein LOC8083224 [Sorghum bicolor]EER96862.1 hypothetical protein SORBI_3002G226500 [Sorghum bicolor]|eukprot:XP_002460341.1 uncharacterized protein LOC8083224 [Sorghum bicolor]
MACVNMYNPEHHQHQSAPSFMAPRMSFSSDFAVEPPPPAAARGGAAAPGDADFEFSVGSHPMMAADQLFSKGRLLPLREAPHQAGASGRPVTLRDELRADERHGRVPRAPNIRWKELLGLKKAPKKQAAAADAAAGTSTDAHMDLGGQQG